MRKHSLKVKGQTSKRIFSMELGVMFSYREYCMFEDEVMCVCVGGNKNYKECI